MSILRSQFPKRSALTLSETGFTMRGWSPQTVRNLRYEGKFPFPIVKIAGREMVLIEALERLICLPSVPAENDVQEPENTKRKPGRPKKVL